VLNFRYVPLKYRVPFGSIMGIAWTAFLSAKTSTIDVEKLGRASA
jgi:protein Mpv17